MAIQVLQLEEFDRVRFKGPGVLKVIQTDGPQKLTIHAPAYVMEDVQAEVRDGQLRLGWVSPKIVRLKVRREVISYELKVHDIRELIHSGFGAVSMPDFDVDSLHLKLSGLGRIHVDQLTADDLKVEISGAGKVQVIGDVELQRVIISGAGTYEATRLVSDVGTVKISGAGSASVTVNDDLDVYISGSGSVNYVGFPEITKRISGSGRLKRIRRERDQASADNK